MFFLNFKPLALDRRRASPSPPYAYDKGQLVAPMKLLVPGRMLAQNQQSNDTLW
jgi:hypothetical protein